MSGIVQIDQKQSKKKWVDISGYFENYHSKIILKHFAPIPDAEWHVRYQRNILKGIFPFMLSIAEPVMIFMIYAYLTMRLI